LLFCIVFSVHILSSFLFILGGIYGFEIVSSNAFYKYYLVFSCYANNPCSAICGF